VVTTGGAEVPIDPLLREIEKLRKRLGVTVDKGQHESDFESFCESLGVSDRTIRDWRAGNRSMVRMATVDRILTNTDWHWWDVWGPDDPGYEKVRQAFEGDEEELAA
jgi:transcriptional regulator with XRE-family HTH domain